MTNDELLAQLDALETAINRGTRVVRYKDKYEEFRSLAEMEQIRTRLRRQLGLESAQPADVLIEYNKGTVPRGGNTGTRVTDWTQQ